MVEFGELGPDGVVRNVRTISSEAIRKCPHVIFDASHYRDDETCKCDDPQDSDMKGWGYTWNAALGQWSSEEE